MRLAPSLHRLGNDIVACYLVDTPDGITLIDAGLPGHWRDLQRELQALGKSADDIRGLVLTHGDSDHIGFAERLRRDHGVPVYVHSADAARARTGEKPKTSFGPMRIGPTLGFLPFGPTVPEMAAVMGSLGCRDAMLLDGGISARLLVRDAEGRAHAWEGFRPVPLALVATPVR